MAFVSGMRNILLESSRASSILQSHLSSIRLSSTLTSPKLFVSGLSRLTTDDKLKESFSPFGELREAKVIVDRASGRSKGFAFVTYSTIEEAEKAREGMNAKFLDGWVIFVDPAKPREARPPPQQQSQIHLKLDIPSIRLSDGAVDCRRRQILIAIGVESFLAKIHSI